MDLRLERDADLFGRALERLRDLLALLVLDHLALGPSENARLRDQARNAHLNSEGEGSFTASCPYWLGLGCFEIEKMLHAEMQLIPNE